MTCMKLNTCIYLHCLKFYTSVKVMTNGNRTNIIDLWTGNIFIRFDKLLISFN